METLKVNLEKLKKQTWTDQELRNVELASSFIEKLMNEHDFQYVLDHFDNSRYKQHNRGIPDGVKNLVKYVEGFVKRWPDYTYDVKRIHADGDYVIFHSHITTNKKDRGNDAKGFNASDTWKIENYEIVEHWDSLQPMNGFMRFFFWLIGGRVANRNGVY